MPALVHRIFMAKLLLSNNLQCTLKNFAQTLPLDVFDLYKKEVMEIRKLSGYCGIWKIFQTANIL